MLVDEERLVREDERWVVAGDLGDLPHPAGDQRVPRSAARAPAGGRAHAPRAGVRRGRALPLRRAPRALARAVGVVSSPRSRLARPPRPDPAGSREHLRRRGVPVPAPPDSRCRVSTRSRRATRADLHERFAEWLERAAGTRIREYEEIVGYHLEQAYRCRAGASPGGRSYATPRRARSAAARVRRAPRPCAQRSSCRDRSARASDGAARRRRAEAQRSCSPSSARR